MTHPKKPLAGEWWQKANTIRGVVKPRVYVLGTSPDGKTVGMRRWLPGELHDGGSDFFYGTLDGIEGMEHLPDCTGWNWSPETFPQWFISEAAHASHVAFYVRQTRNSFYRAYFDGKESNLIMWDEVNDGFVADGKWKQITQEEAELRREKHKTEHEISVPGFTVHNGKTLTAADIESIEQSASGIEAIVCADIAERQRLGVAKYGTTVKDNPLTVKEWLTHAYQECLDQAVYLRRAIDEL